MNLEANVLCYACRGISSFLKKTRQVKYSDEDTSIIMKLHRELSVSEYFTETSWREWVINFDIQRTVYQDIFL